MTQKLRAPFAAQFAYEPHFDRSAMTCWSLYYKPAGLLGPMLCLPETSIDAQTVQLCNMPQLAARSL